MSVSDDMSFDALACATADLVWWDGLTAVDQNLQANINRLVVAAEVTKLTEVNAWADASRQKEQFDEGISEMVEARGRNVLEPEGVTSLAVGLTAGPPSLGGAMLTTRPAGAVVPTGGGSHEQRFGIHGSKQSTARAVNTRHQAPSSRLYRGRQLNASPSVIILS